MEYMLRVYETIDDFNDAATGEFGVVMAQRNATSYDRWWIVHSIWPRENGTVMVLWARVAPLRKH